MAEPNVIQPALAAGYQRCLTAELRIRGFGPIRGRPGARGTHRGRARELARRIFHVENADLNYIARVIAEMKNWLIHPNVAQRATANDVRCPQPGAFGFEAFVVNNRPPIHLCPPFFETTDEQRIRTMIHEAAHLTGIGDLNEVYYFRFDCKGEAAGMLARGTGGALRGSSRMADSWAHFVHCMSGQRPDTVNVRRQRVPPGITEERIHVVQWGDYLTKLARQYYGDPQLWRRIHNANRETIGPNPDKIFPGQRLVIP